MAAPSEKCVLILDQDLPAGLLANTAAILGITLGQRRPAGHHHVSPPPLRPRPLFLVRDRLTCKKDRPRRASAPGAVLSHLGPRSTGWTCLPSRAASTASFMREKSATREVGFPTGSS